MIKPLSDPATTASPRAASAATSPPVSAPAPEQTSPDPDVADAAWIADAIDQFEAPLTQYAARLLSGDVDRARDVVQDTFLKLWTADRAAVNGHLGQWLYRVCRNRALDVRRKESRMTALKDEQLELAGRADTAAGGQVLRGRHDEADNDSAAMRATPNELPGPAVMALLGTLNDTQQEALRLKFQGGLSYKEIAAVMDITSNHVGVLIHHAIKALREHLAAQRHPSSHGIQPGSAGA